jgi:hypothetical protein
LNGSFSRAREKSAGNLLDNFSIVINLQLIPVLERGGLSDSRDELDHSLKRESWVFGLQAERGRSC